MKDNTAGISYDIKFKGTPEQISKVAEILEGMGVEKLHINPTGSLFVYQGDCEPSVMQTLFGDDFYRGHKFISVDPADFIAEHLPKVRIITAEEAMELINGPKVQPSGKVKSDGGSSDYYKLTIRTKQGSFECETGDVIRAMVGNNFDLGNALKALRRIYEASQGRGKDGIDMSYDANKINYFVNEFVEYNK